MITVRQAGAVMGRNYLPAVSVTELRDDLITILNQCFYKVCEYHSHPDRVLSLAEQEQSLYSDKRVSFAKWIIRIAEESSLQYTYSETAGDEIEWGLRTLGDYKLELIGYVRNSAKSRLDEMDWKVLRHIEQKALGVTTTITESEYLSLLQEKQNIRELSSLKEEAILAADNYTSLISIANETNL